MSVHRGYFMQARGILSVLAAATFVAACTSGTSSSGPATMSVRLVDAPTGDYAEVNIDVQTVLIKGDGDWLTLGSPGKVYNLLELTKGVSATLVEGATIPAGHYGQMRLILGSRNTVKLPDGTIHDLKVPSGQQSGVKLVVHFDVEAGTTADVYIDFDAHKSVFVHEAGNSGKYILRPTVRAYDKLETGTISGTLTDAGTTSPLVGVEVTAQAIVDGDPVVVSSDITDDKGFYVLGLLPIGGSYHVVSQPVTVDASGAFVASYEARAGAALAITATAPVRTYDASFTRAPDPGVATGAITPVAALPQVDLVKAVFPLDAGAGLQDFVVRTVTGVVVADAETWTMPWLPASSTPYTISGERRSVDASGADVVAPSTNTPPLTVKVTSGETATAADLTFLP